MRRYITMRCLSFSSSLCSLLASSSRNLFSICPIGNTKLVGHKRKMLIRPKVKGKL
ncbi:hypothetical protein Mapa_002604 [Marchantia paleacea]|nr:hypothetical protein Mapa_002604 [Marchantia paleacea]